MLAKLALTVYLAIVIVCDLRTRTIPNRLTLPVMVGVLGWQFCKTGWAALVILAFWIGIFTLWAAHLYGGGDAKLLMVLFALWPRTDFLLVEAGLSLLIGIPLLIWKYRGKPWPEAARSFQQALEQKQGGYPWGAIYALGGIVFAWLGV